MKEHVAVHYAFRYGKTNEGINAIIRAAYWCSEMDAAHALNKYADPVVLANHQRTMNALTATGRKHAEALANNRYFLDLACTRSIWNEERKAYA